MTPDDAAAITVELRALGDKLDGVHRSLSDDIIEVRDEAKKTNGRLRELERWRARIEGAVSGVGVFAPILTGVITALVVLALTGSLP